MSVLVIAEHHDNILKPITSVTVSAASKIDSDIHVLLAGDRCDAMAQEIAQIQGVKKVLVADAPSYKHLLSENLSELVVKHATGHTHLLAPASTFGKDLMPRVAAMLDVGQISDIISVESSDTFIRPIYAGNALATVKSSDKVKVITVRGTAFDAAGKQDAASIEKINDVFDPQS